MRRLTIKRENSSFASKVELGVFVEDIYESDLTLGETNYRKIGAINNDSEVSMEIFDESVNLIVVDESKIKNNGYELCTIPAGTEDIFVCGVMRYDGANGTYFSYLNMPYVTMVKRSKKATFRAVLILVVACILVVLLRSGFDMLIKKGNMKPQTFTDTGVGFSITLTKEFEVEEYDQCDIFYRSDDVMFLVYKEDFDLTDEEFASISVEEYCLFLIDEYGLSSETEMQQADGLTYFDYEVDVDDYRETMCCMEFLYKSDNDFWCLRFITEKTKYDELKPRILEWAKTATFDIASNL